MKFYIFLSLLISLSCNVIGSAGPSSLDTSFNSSGILNLPAALPASTVQSLAIQPDGKIVYAGYVGNGSTSYGIVGRINANGSPDLTFNASGTQGYSILTPNGSSSLQSSLFDVQLQADGKIVVVGTTQQSGNNYFYLLIARYLANGTLDITTGSTTGFGTGGVGYTFVTPPSFIGAQLYGVAILANGSFIAAGTAISTQTGSNPTSTSPMIVQFTSLGIVNTAFGTSGYTIATSAQIANQSFGGYNDIAIQNDGNFVATGYCGSKFQSPFGTYYASPVIGQMIVARYTSTGVIEPYFNNGNILIPSSTIVGTISMGFAIKLQSDQKIIVVGMANPASAANPSPTVASYTIMRLNINGSIDTTFNSNGPIPGINQSIFNTTEQSSCQDVLIQPFDQKIVTAGMNTTPSGYFNLVVIRYEVDGTIDPSFDFTTNQTAGALQFRAVAITPDQKIVAAGIEAMTNYYLLFYQFLGGSTPELGITSTVNAYGYNPQDLTEFFYINSYAQIIANPVAQAAAITLVNTIFLNYISAYENQPGFNYISYAYLMNTQLLAAQNSLNTIYTDATTQAQITQFFNYIFERENKLLVANRD